MDRSRVKHYTFSVLQVKIAIGVAVLLVVFFFIANDVFRKDAKFAVNFTTFPHYLRAYELLIALDTGSLALLVVEWRKIAPVLPFPHLLLNAAWAFIVSIALSFLFILVFIRQVQNSRQIIDSGNPDFGYVSRFQFLVSIPLAISAVVAFLLGYAYLAESFKFAFSNY